MKLSDKVMIIIGCIATLLIMWHVFAPRDMWIEGFYGFPMMICMLLDKIRSRGYNGVANF